MIKQHKFSVLDAIRGLAALLVMMYHAGPLVRNIFSPYSFPDIFDHAYLAVDVFFSLSGFVLSYAYQQKLDGGRYTSDFLKIRLIRIYPLYLVGLLLGSWYQFHADVHGGWIGILPDVALFVAALFFLPAPFGTAFPLNSPTWSLFFELEANIVHALFLRNRSTRTLCLIALTFGALFFISTLHYGRTLLGVFSSDIGAGSCRVLFSYLVGMLLFRFWNRNKRRWEVSSIWPILICLIIMISPRLPRFDLAFQLAMIFVALPLATLLASFAVLPKRVAPGFDLLATASYALYVLHTPLLLLFFAILRVHGQFGLHLPPLVQGTAFLIFVLAIPICADKYFDTPIRQWLRTKFLPQRKYPQS